MRHHLVSACLAAGPAAPYAVAAAAAAAAAAAVAAAVAAEVAAAAGRAFGVAAVLAAVLAVEDAAAAAVAVEQLEQIWAGTLTVTLALLSYLVCPLFLIGLASPARLEAFRGRPAALQTPLPALQHPLSAFHRPAADGCAALLVAEAPC